MNTNVTREKIQGRKPSIKKYLNKFLDKHGPTGKHGMRFNSQKGLEDIDAAIVALTNLKQQIVIPPVPVVTTENQTTKETSPETETAPDTAPDTTPEVAPETSPEEKSPEVVPETTPETPAETVSA